MDGELNVGEPGKARQELAYMTHPRPDKDRGDMLIGNGAMRKIVAKSDHSPVVIPEHRLDQLGQVVRELRYQRLGRRVLSDNVREPQPAVEGRPPDAVSLEEGSCHGVWKFPQAGLDVGSAENRTKAQESFGDVTKAPQTKDWMLLSVEIAYRPREKDGQAFDRKPFGKWLVRPRPYVETDDELDTALAKPATARPIRNQPFLSMVRASGEI